MDKQKKKKFLKVYCLKILFLFLITLVVVLAIINIFMAYKFEGEYSNVFTAISGWVSFLATFIIGLIAYMQNKKYKKENDDFIKEQKELSWKNNYVDLCRRFFTQLCEHGQLYSKYYPQKLERMFLKNLEEKCFYDYELMVSDFESIITHFLIFLRKSQIFNDKHSEVYDALLKSYTTQLFLMNYFNEIMDKEIQYDKQVCGNLVKNALKNYNNFVDSLYMYKENLNLLMTDIYEMDIDTLRTNLLYQKEKHKEWYKKVKNIPEYIANIIKETNEDKNNDVRKKEEQKREDSK